MRKRKSRELIGKQTVLVIIEFCPCQFNWKQYSHHKQERSVDYFKRREWKKRCDLCRQQMQVCVLFHTGYPQCM
jgi:hypothetical protein